MRNETFGDAPEPLPYRSLKKNGRRLQRASGTPAQITFSWWAPAQIALAWLLAQRDDIAPIRAPSGLRASRRTPPPTALS
jgi:hypothetical protein